MLSGMTVWAEKPLRSGAIVEPFHPLYHWARVAITLRVKASTMIFVWADTRRIQRRRGDEKGQPTRLPV
jgi:hypothetical protein